MTRFLPLAVAALLLVTACTDGDDTDEEPEELAVSWREVTLPTPPGPAGRVAVRDATTCGDEWFVVGGIFVADGESRPAAWRSTDGLTWTSLPLVPVGYWAQRAVLSSVACRDGRVAMVGAKSGGAHGNPRVTTWYQRNDGTWTDVIAAFELYGGPLAVSVGRITAGPPGWLISGNRTSGAAVWLSPDATEFELIDGAPQLAKDEGHDTTAIDAVHDGTGWTVVGSATIPGRVPRVPMAWTSADGRSWQREKLPQSKGFTDLERVVRHDDGLLAAGIRDDTFALWRRTDGRWGVETEFSSLDPEGRASPFVSGLVGVGDDVLATVSDAKRYHLWALSGDDAQPVRIPVRPTTAGEHILTVAADGDEVLLLTDDGEQGRVWRTDW